MNFFIIILALIKISSNIFGSVADHLLRHNLRILTLCQVYSLPNEFFRLVRIVHISCGRALKRRPLILLHLFKPALSISRWRFEISALGWSYGLSRILRKCYWASNRHIALDPLLIFTFFHHLCQLLILTGVILQMFYNLKMILQHIFIFKWFLRMADLVNKTLLNWGFS